MDEILHIINNTSLMRFFPNLGVADIIEIIILTFLIYYLIRSLKGTRAWVLSKGLMTLLIFYIVSYTLHFNVIVSLFQNALLFLGIAIVVTIQPELRRLIERLGRKNINITLKSIIKTIFKYNNTSGEPTQLLSDNVIQEIVKGCAIMSKAKTGVLIVIERDIPLHEYIESGILVNADITSALLINVFEKNTPLHDGAVIVRENRLTAATCYLPLSESSDINKDLGTRHRAGIGITETTDAFVIIVSEETGAISVAKDGELLHDIDREQLSEELKKIQIRNTEDDTKKKRKTANLDEFNLHYKIISVTSAFIIWVMAVSNLNPINTIVLRDIPIQLVNTSVVESTGKTFEVLGDLKTVDVRVTDRKLTTDTITANDIKVIADFNKLSYVNSIPLEYDFDGTSEISLSESTMQISLEDIATTEVTLEVERIGETNDLYYISDVNLDYDTVVISGARSVINTIGRVVLNIDESKLTHNTTLELTPVVYDKNGEVIDISKLNFNRDVIKASVELYKTKRVPLNIEVIIDNPVLQSLITSIDYDNKQIVITGSDEVLNQTNSVDIAVPISIELSDITQKEYIRNIQLNNYITTENLIVTTQYNRVNITMQIVDFYTKSFDISSNNIIYEGLGEGLSATIKPDNIHVDMVSSNKNIEDKAVESIAPYVDLTGLGEGSHEVLVKYKDLTVNAYTEVKAQVSIVKHSVEE